MERSIDANGGTFETRIEGAMWWVRGAACATIGSEIFFSEDTDEILKAQKICNTCEVSEQCLNFVLRNPQEFGVWGGLSEDDRRLPNSPVPSLDKDGINPAAVAITEETHGNSIGSVSHAIANAGDLSDLPAKITDVMPPLGGIEKAYADLEEYISKAYTKTQPQLDPKAPSYSAVRPSILHRTAPSNVDNATVVLDGFRQYQGRIPKKLLTAEEEISLAKIIEVGLFATEMLAARSDSVPLDECTPSTLELYELQQQGRAAQEQFLLSNQGLVIKIASRYVWSGVPMMDLIQEGNIGLITALRRFDFTKGNKFSTFAYKVVLKSIMEATHDLRRVIVLPTHKSELVSRALKLKGQRESELQRIVDWPELLGELGIKEGHLDSFYSALRVSGHPASIDAPVYEDSATTYADILGDKRVSVDTQAIEMAEGSTLELIIGIVIPKERDRKILKLSYGLSGRPPLSYNEIAQSVGVSSSRVHQIIEKALNDLRSYLTSENPNPERVSALPKH